MKAYKILGTSDDVTTCGCCGRENLKKTVVLSKLDADGNAIADGDAWVVVGRCEPHKLDADPGVVAYCEVAS